MLEVEAKARVSDLGEVRRRLTARGATREGEEAQRDTYYAHPARDFASTDEALRLREAGGRVELTYKGPKLGGAAKAREELTLALQDPGGAALLLERLGFRRVATVAKRRETWRLGEAEVALDEVDGLGAFMEVELAGAGAGEGEREALAARVLAMLRDLGGGESLRASYLEMLLAARGRA